jgi:hypothetical protein
MFIAEDGTRATLRLGVPRPPSGGPCQSLKTRDELYKHGPATGGRARLVTASINMALLTEGVTPPSGDLSSASPPDSLTQSRHAVDFTLEHDRDFLSE